MSEQFIIENTSFEQDLNAELSEDSFEVRRRIRNSSRGKSKAIARGKRRVKRSQTALRKITRRLR